MSILSFQGFSPRVGTGCFIAPSAQVIGRVDLGDHVNIWFQTVIRGDMDQITIGKNTNIQDLCMLHVDKNIPLLIGENVSVGHHAVLHACRIGAHSLIGMGAIILDNVEVGENCLVAAGSLLPPGKKYPAGSMVMGSPAKVVRPLTSAECQKVANHYLSYLDLKNKYLKELPLT